MKINKSLTRGQKFRHYNDYLQKLFKRIWFAQTDQAKIYLINEIEKTKLNIKKLNRELPEIKYSYNDMVMKLYESYKKKYE